MKFGIVVFPGSNCDHDAFHVIHEVLRQPCEFLWHKDRDLKGVDCVILPGGFSFGDYLRCGAIARFSPLMEDVIAFAARGGRVIGVCNGFQILCEARLLPGVLLRNRSLQFVCRDVNLRVENAEVFLTRGIRKGEVLRMPVAHAEGNYFADEETLRRLEGEGRVVFRYATPAGEVTDEANPNGAIHNIAGIVNERGNVAGLMPHPERASEAILGSVGGRRIFEALVA
jgi:phosphoribosylformylglycinamidine synthase subunit PurQ / glutaminase